MAKEAYEKYAIIDHANSSYTSSSVRFFNVLLRSATLLSRFVLLFFLAKFLDPKDVGLYGLLVGTISYALFVLGFEFYTYSTRELIGTDKRKWLALIRDQSVFFLFAYFLVLPLLLIVFLKEWLPWAYASWFFVLLILEHVAQELNRLLVVMSQQLFASVILFLRGGAWALLLILVMWLLPSARALESVLFAWFFGVSLACIFGMLRVLALDRKALHEKIDWPWIYKGIKTMIPFLIASLAIRGVFTFDRYWVESIAGLDVLGAYVLFVGITNAVVAFLDSGVIVFSYPQIVAAAKSGNEKAFAEGMKKLLWNVVLFTLVLVVGALVSSRPLLSLIGKNIYVENLFLLNWLLLATVLFSISMVPHVGLYAYGKDRAILLSQLLGLIVFCAGVFLGKLYYGVLAVPLALCLSFSSILILKVIAYRSMRYKQA